MTDAKSGTPRTKAMQHNMGSITQPHYVVDVGVSEELETELNYTNERMAYWIKEYEKALAALALANAEVEQLKSQINGLEYLLKAAGG